jgi:hypothetical protein
MIPEWNTPDRDKEHALIIKQALRDKGYELDTEKILAVIDVLRKHPKLSQENSEYLATIDAVYGTYHRTYQYYTSYADYVNLALLYYNSGKLCTNEYQTLYDLLTPSGKIKQFHTNSLRDKKFFANVQGKLSKLVMLNCATMEHTNEEVLSGGKIRKIDVVHYKITDYGRDVFEGKAKIPIMIGYRDRDVVDWPEKQLCYIEDIIYQRFRFDKKKSRLLQDDTLYSNAKTKLSDVNTPYIRVDDLVFKHSISWVKLIMLYYIIYYQVVLKRTISYEELDKNLKKYPNTFNNANSLIKAIMDEYNVRLTKFSTMVNDKFYVAITVDEEGSCMLDATELNEMIFQSEKSKWSASLLEAKLIKTTHGKCFEYTNIDKRTYYLPSEELAQQLRKNKLYDSDLLKEIEQMIEEN